jgi:hypothetical protein
LLLLAVGPAGAVSPGPNARLSLLPLGSCEAQPEQACFDPFDCDDARGGPSACSTTFARRQIRGFLTVIADKDSSLEGPPIPLTEDAAGNTVPTDFSGTTLTLLLEFKHRGERHMIAESFRDLGPSVIPELNIDCAGFCFPTWREPAVESRVAEEPNHDDTSGAGGGGGDGGGAGGGGGSGQQAGGEGIRILWATLPPAAAAEVVRILGLPENAVPFVEMVDERDIFDHSGEEDLLASVHRLKVVIRAILPED